MPNAQEWLNQNYPNKEEVGKIERGYGEEKITGELIIADFPQVKKMDVHDNQLTQLHLKNCPQLTYLNCSDNKLTELTITNCPNLRKIEASDNHLTNLDLSNNQQLKELWISNNNFSSDLSFLSHLVNLKDLRLHHNNFIGSLEPLQNLQKLEILYIMNTKFSQGLEHLPTSIVDFRCQGTKLAKELEPLGFFRSNIKKWREDKINKWKEKGFTEQEIKEWIAIGLGVDEYGLADYLKCKIHVLNQTLNLIESREEYKKELKNQRTTLERLQRIDDSILHQRWKEKYFLGLNQQKLQEQLKTLEAKETELRELIQKISEMIPFFERQIEMSEILIKKQKEDLTKNYLLSFTEEQEEDIQRLIKTHRDYMLAKAQREEVGKYLDKYSNFRKRLENKYQLLEDKQFIIKADSLLLEFERLYFREWDLQEQVKQKEENIKSKIVAENQQNQIQQLFQEAQKNLIEFNILQTKLQKLQLETVEKSSKLITEKVINTIEEITENSDKIFSSIEKPVLETKIGQGGYGEVYWGKWESREVAIKKPFLVDESEKQEIRNEINALKKLKHQNIIQYYGVYYENQEILIIMEYAENGTLTQFIDNQANQEHNWNFNTNLIKQIASGLSYIHHKNIIHCDLKSLNVLMIANNHQAKISDFGLSRIRGFGSSQSSDVKGSLRWIAPEVLRDKKHSQQSDIYSLGMVIWEIAAKCTKPFKNIDDNSTALHIINGKKETIPSDTPKNIYDIIQGCWKDNPNERINLKNIFEAVESKKPQVIELTNVNESTNNTVKQSQNQMIDNQTSICDMELGDNDFTSQKQSSLQSQIQLPPKSN